MNQAEAEEYTQSLGQIVSGSWRQISLAKRLGVPEALGLTTEQWVTNRLGGYVKMGIAERREAVGELAANGHSNREIGTIIGVDEKTVRNIKAAENSADGFDNPVDGSHMTSKDADNSAPLDAVAALAADESVKRAAQIKAAREEKEQAREERREDNRQKIASAPEPLKIISGRFATITLDPPWDWGDEGDQDQLGRARPTYETWSIDRLMGLPIDRLSDDDCHLYLWITNRSLPKGFMLLERWNFRYVTALTWAKPHFGMGNYFRGQTEHILFGVKGSQPLKRRDVGTVFQWPRGPNGHSSKPAEFYGLAESCSPGPYLEMFSRSERPGWVMWGENSA